MDDPKNSNFSRYAQNELNSGILRQVPEVSPTPEQHVVSNLGSLTFDFLICYFVLPILKESKDFYIFSVV
jgi:hypothetical protein